MNRGENNLLFSFNGLDCAVTRAAPRGGFRIIGVHRHMNLTHKPFCVRYFLAAESDIFKIEIGNLANGVGVKHLAPLFGVIGTVFPYRRKRTDIHKPYIHFVALVNRVFNIDAFYKYTVTVRTDFKQALYRKP